MRFDSLRVKALRCLSDVEVSPGLGWNVFVGENGAGKTSILEAAFLLSHGRSFRAGARDAMLQRGAASMSVFAEVSSDKAGQHRLGLGREANRWVARADGENLATLGELLRLCAVVCFEPGSHELIAGAAEERRRFLDWGVFHVEHAFLDQWRRYQRALRQRNQLLRSSRPLDAGLFLAWEQEMAASGEAIHTARTAYLSGWGDVLTTSISALLPELGQVQVGYRCGWAADASLLDVLSDRRERDLQRGHTTMGPHRADWSVSFEHAPQREHLSRGQEKLCALACLLAQAEVFAQTREEWPVLCLDDLASELDEAHQERVVAHVATQDVQILVTGTGLPDSLAQRDARVFHVEQGRVRGLL